VQQMLLVKEAPEEQSPGVDHIKEEQEELWISQEEGGQLSVKEEIDAPRCPETLHLKEELWTGLEGEQLSVKEADANMFPLTAAPLKSEDDEEKPLFSQLHQIENRDIPTSSAADQMKVEPDEEDYGGAESNRKTDLNTHGDTFNSSETEDSEEDDVNHPDSGSETEDSNDDWKESRTRESGGNSVSRSISCSDCGQQFDTKLSLQNHMADHSPNSSSANGKSLSEKKNVDTPKKDQKGLKCDECGKSFEKKNHLNKHMRVHTGEKPFGCHLCGQSFSIKSTLNSHMRVHTGEKPFGCD
ncbi:hypothetical protein GOODEAATRI_032190, partial [Goodea atripinnis]